MKKLSITAIMITLNEDYHLPTVIENLKPWVTEIFVVDSCSTDHTVSIALEHGVKIVQRKFTNYGDHWNFALENLPVKTPWTFVIAPDERVTPKLVEEMTQVVNVANPSTGYEIPIRLWFMGQPLHSRLRMVRLWKTGSCRFSDVIVNEHVKINGPVSSLESCIEHLDSRDLNHWMDKQNRYTTMEAIMKIRDHDLAATPKILGNSLERRMLFKKYFNMLPFRYQFYWIYLMIVQGAWRDGKAGRVWAHLRTEVMRMIEFKASEMRTTGRIPEVPRAPHGDYDHRVMATPLQQKIMQAKNWENLH